MPNHSLNQLSFIFLKSTMTTRKMRYIILFCILFMSISCGMRRGGGLNFFPVSKDVKLGRKVTADIEDKAEEFPLLSEEENEKVYSYIRNIVDRLLATGEVRYHDRFEWQVKIIQDDETLNAFATPGGHLYLYTGLIKFLDTEDQLAGVLGHEIAHAAQRHSTRLMTASMGLTALKIVAIRQADNTFADFAHGLTNLRFSRGHESEADRYSVKYLCAAGYNPTGIAGFFQKMEGQKTPPDFLNTHPNPRRRISKIEKYADKLDCPPKPEKTLEYKRIRKLLP